MATWQEIGVDNFRAGRELFDAKRYRSSVSRFYCAAFSVLTHELLQTSFLPKEERETPDHAHLPEWIKTYLTKYTLRQRTDMASAVRRLYERRLAADYRLRTVDEQTAREARRDAVLVFTYLEVEL